MGANFAVVKTWADAEVLTAADLNAEFQNVITNFTPSGMDDESSDITAMQATKDPYSGGSAVLPTSLQEEIQELRYMIQQITGKTYWYVDADSALCPTGSVILWTTDSAPTGFLLCYGQAINRTTYAALFAIIGTTYGVGDGSTTFNVPDLRGRFPLGQDDMGGSSANRVTDTDADTLGGADGDEWKDLSHTHTGPSHQHTVPIGWSQTDNVGVGFKPTTTQYSGTFTAPDIFHSMTTDPGHTFNQALSGAGGTAATGSGGSSSQDVMPPFITLNYIIKT